MKNNLEITSFRRTSVIRIGGHAAQIGWCSFDKHE